MGDLSSIPGLGRFPGEGNGNPLQYCCLENPMDGGAWCPWGHKELDTTERLHFYNIFMHVSCFKFFFLYGPFIEFAIILLLLFMFWVFGHMIRGY